MSRRFLGLGFTGVGFRVEGSRVFGGGVCRACVYIYIAHPSFLFIKKNDLLGYFHWCLGLYFFYHFFYGPGRSLLKFRESLES